MALFDDTRSAWAARRPTSTKTVLITARTEFFSHWAGEAVGLFGKPHSACLAQVKRWQTQHMDAQGWSDIGYNGLVCPHARAIEGRGIAFAGAHCPDHNTSGLGWQFMVGEGETVTPAMFARMRQAYDDCSSRAGRELAKRGHRDGFATECPGDQVYAWVKAGMPAPTQGEEEMATIDLDDARLILTGAAVLKNPFAADPDTAPRVAASYVLEQTAAKVAEIAAKAAPSAPQLTAADHAAIAAKVADLIAVRLKA